MVYSVGDILYVDSESYRVVGKITYRNTYDSSCWDEYRMMKLDGGGEAWLSVDDVYKEYSISRVVRTVNRTGYHEVDRGREIVDSAIGSVDVGRGDTAEFVEYEDSTEEKIISEERWDDGTEYSEGYYLDEDEISFIRHDDDYKPQRSSGGNQTGAAGTLVAAIVVIFMAIPFLSGILGNISTVPSIKKFLKGSSNYTYVTSITGNDKQKADVYKAGSNYSVDLAVRDIINAVNGETEYVQQDTENSDGAVGIITKKEYCFVYLSEDNEVLVQISSRKYAYTSDNEIYRGRRHHRRYYRSFYHSTGYSYDSSAYKSSNSSYSSYSDGDISYTGTDKYNTYSGSVRQDSINSRQSSGGGLSSGK